jgi:hypothetical protein
VAGELGRRNAQILAYLTDKKVIDFTVTGYGGYAVCRWVHEDCVVASLPVQNAAHGNQVTNKLMAFHDSISTKGSR